jgi:hypothetical protein
MRPPFPVSVIHEYAHIDLRECDAVRMPHSDGIYRTLPLCEHICTDGGTNEVDEVKCNRSESARTSMKRNIVAANLNEHTQGRSLTGHYINVH